jgi:hypothetical protein
LKKTPGSVFRARAELLEGYTDDNGRCRCEAQNHSQERAEDACCRFTRRNPEASGETRTRENFSSQIAVTGSDVFGREEDLAFLDRVWANQHVNVVTIVAWAGVGKSTLVNHWLRQMAAEHYRSAELVFARVSCGTMVFSDSRRLRA